MEHSKQDDFVLTHLDWVRQLSLQLVQDVATADDVVQEVWLAARGRLPHEANRDARGARAWLAGIARNVARRQTRTESRRKVREVASAIRADVPQEDVNLLKRSELLTRVAQIVTKLDEPFRRAMLLRWFDGLSNAEIARQEGIGIDTVKSRLHRGKQRVRAALDAESDGDSRAWALGLVPVALRALRDAAPVAGGFAKLALIAASVVLIAGAGAWSLQKPLTSASDVELAEAIPADALPVKEQEIAEHLVDSKSEPRSDLAPVGSPAPIVSGDRLRVYVVEANGDPAVGVTVGMGRVEKDGHVYPLLPRPETDNSGLVEFDWNYVKDMHATDGEVWAEIPARVQPRLGFSGAVNGGPPAALLLRLPPTGTVAVQLVDHRGLSINGRISLLLASNFLGYGTRTRVGADLVNGRAEFRHVLLGERFELGTNSLGSFDKTRWLRGSGRFDGPASEGEVVLITLNPIADSVLYTGRAMAIDGQPLASFRLDLVASVVLSAERTVVPVSKETLTDENGYFTIGLATEPPEGQLFIELSDAEFRNGDTLEAKVEVPRTHAGQSIAIGDVIFRMPPRWVSGRVTDLSGNPLAGACVSLDRFVGERGDGALARRSDEAGEFWFPPFDSDGAVDVGGLPRYELEARDFYYTPVTRPISVDGESGLAIRLEPQGQVRVRVLADPEFADSLSMKASPADASDECAIVQREYESEFRSSYLSPGIWDLDVYGSFLHGVSLSRTRGVEVASGELNRVAAIDLRGEIRSITLRAFNGNGDPFAGGANLFLRDPRTGSKGYGMLDTEGVAEFVLPNRPIQVRVVAHGYSEVETLLINREETIFLTR